MPRSILFLLIFVLLIVTAVSFLSIQAEEMPTRTIEADIAGENRAQ